MTVEFERSNGELVNIGEATTEQGCLSIIQKFLDAHNFKSYYTRYTNVGDDIWIDVGSHTEFFWIRGGTLND